MQKVDNLFKFLTGYLNSTKKVTAIIPYEKSIFNN